jgi:hypothetical protein
MVRRHDGLESQRHAAAIRVLVRPQEPRVGGRRRGAALAPLLLKTLDADDWTRAATSGTIDIDPDDGDGITAIASHKNDLWVFKGPYKGSIHRITGSANTGSDSFARIPFISGIGAVSHNTIFKFRDDLGFMWSDCTIHSLAATAAYGDFNESALSRPIHRYMREHVNFAQLKRAWAATHVSRSIVPSPCPIDTSTFPNQLLDDRLQPPAGVVGAVAGAERGPASLA